jgi:hypothetical protein
VTDKPVIDVWLDDIRDPQFFYPAFGFIWVKTVDEFKAMMATHQVRFASLDHDLGACRDCSECKICDGSGRTIFDDPAPPDDYIEQDCQTCNGKGWLNPEEWLIVSQFTEMPNCSHVGTGYDLVLWMAENNNWPSEKPQVHSANTVGAPRMRGVIDRYYPEKEKADDQGQPSDSPV